MTTTPRQRRLLRWLLVTGTAAFVLASLVIYSASVQLGRQELVDAMALLVPCAYGGVGVVLTSRRPHNQVGWLCSWIGLVWGLTDAADALAHWAADTGRFDVANWAGALAPLWLVAVMLTLHLLLRLPNGGLLSPRWRWCSRLCTVTMVALPVVLGTAPGQVSGIAGTRNPVAVPQLQPLSPLFALLFVCLVGAVASLVLRYRRGDAVEQTQLRWIAFSGVILLAVGGSIGIFIGGSGSMPPVVGAIDVLANAALPVAIGIAVLRYRLYDIDVVINRALVYGLLTATLAATYVTLVLLFHLVVRPFTHDSALATAASTLAVAALFGPARTRIQELVDRRFYRSKYDAARTLEAFSARLRNEVDLETLTADLRSVATETMQPEHASIWLVRDRTGRSPAAP